MCYGHKVDGIEMRNAVKNWECRKSRISESVLLL